MTAYQIMSRKAHMRTFCRAHGIKIVGSSFYTMWAHWGAASVETLKKITAVAAGAFAPFIAGAHPTFLGLDQFQKLVRDLAMQVAGLRPIYPTIESIPAAELEAKREHFLADEGVQQKPEHIRGQIVEGQLKKWFADVVLTEQPFRDEERTVGELITEVIAKTGENIRVRRFVRFELGEEL